LVDCQAELCLPLAQVHHRRAFASEMSLPLVVMRSSHHSPARLFELAAAAAAAESLDCPSLLHRA